MEDQKKPITYQRGRPPPNREIDVRTRIEKTLGRFGFGIICFIIALFIAILSLVLVLTMIGQREVRGFSLILVVLAFFIRPFVASRLRKIFENIEK